MKRPAKSKAAAKKKAVKRAAKKRVKPDTSQVPASLAPPPMPDHRPVMKQVPASSNAPDKGEGVRPQGSREVHQTPPAESTPKAQVAPATPSQPVTLPRKLPLYSGPDGDALVQGLHCTFWGSRSQAAVGEDSVLACPHCQNHLVDSPAKTIFWQGIDMWEAGFYKTTGTRIPVSHPGYRKLIEWMRGKCFSGMEQAAEKYKQENGVEVKP